MGRPRLSASSAPLVPAVMLVLLAACASGGDVPGTAGATSAPASSDPPTTRASATEPPATTAPATEPPTTDPPSTEAPTTSPPEEVDERRHEREAMVGDQIASRGIDDPVVLAAMRAVPRHHFVPDDFDDQAYDDHPLPIGHGQTISQPYIVALMSQFLAAPPGGRVLEIGTGSGYQAAVLAEMGLEVFTIEIVEPLAERAAAALADAGYGTVRTLLADGYFGWEEEAPFDAVIVTAAPDHVPQPLVDQLAPGGRMVIPIGPVGAVQTLWVFTRDEDGELLAESLGAVRFVPFTRAE